MLCSWAAYVAGALVVLMHERGLRFQLGMSLLIDSAVPEGKGVSSSAAVRILSRSSQLLACQSGLGASTMLWQRCMWHPCEAKAQALGNPGRMFVR